MDTPVAERFRKDGYVIAPWLVDRPLLAGLQVEAKQLIRRFINDHYRSEDYWYFAQPSTREPVLYRVHNLEKMGSSAINVLFTKGPLHRLANEVLGVPVRPTACAMIVKMPRVAARVPWHRDRTSVPPHTVCNLSLFLDYSSPDNGSLEFVPGSHLLPGDADVTEAHKQGSVQVVPAEAGDVLIHDVRVVHASRANHTATVRRSIVIEFAPVGLELPNSEG
ncbi:MAG: phytanoyl-CoA dioxygenase family protein [Pseudonocardiaceae bacterium]